MQVAWSQAKCSCGFFQFHLQPNASPPLKKRNIAACRGQSVPPPFCFCLGKAHGGSWPCFFTCPAVQRCAERLPTPSICADVCLPRDILKIKQCQVCRPMQLPVDPARNSGRKLEYLHSWVLFCIIIIIRT